MILLFRSRLGTGDTGHGIEGDMEHMHGLEDHVLALKGQHWGHGDTGHGVEGEMGHMHGLENRSSETNSKAAGVFRLHGMVGTAKTYSAALVLHAGLVKQ